MAQTNRTSNTSFKYGIIALLLLIVLVILTGVISHQNADIVSPLIGLLIISAGIISILGLLKAIKGISEPNTAKKIIGIVLNIGITALFVFVIAANFSDLYRSLTNSY